MNIETQAVNTAGLWYAYVAIDGKCVYQSKEGYADRNDAVQNGKDWLDENLALRVTGE